MSQHVRQRNRSESGFGGTKRRRHEPPGGARRAPAPPRRAGGTALAAAALCIGLAGAAAGTETREVALGRVLIKFKDSFTQCAHCLLEQGQPFAPAMIGAPTRVDRLNAEFGVTGATALFADRHDLAGDAARAMAEDRLAAVRARFPGRTARIPEGSPPPPDMTSWYRFELAADRDPFAVCTEYLKDPHVAACQPDFVAVGDSTAPNDPYYSSRGSFGQPYDDLWGLKSMRAESAWQYTAGQGITVAVVDSGVDMTHPDLAGQFWLNPNESIGGGDDDLNGYVDDLFGWDFVDNDNNPTDINGHGTHVAGIVAAQGNNGIGTIGVAPAAQIMVLRGLNKKMTGYVSHLAQAVVYAANMGADIINNSWACKDPCLYNPVAEDAVRVATTLGSVVVFAAGNENQDVYLRSPQRMSDSMSSPVVVAATDYKRRAADFGDGRGTNFGQTVAIAAPGGGRKGDGSPSFTFPVHNILAPLSSERDPTFLRLEDEPRLIVGGQYVRQAGTSMSAPHVAGIAALLEACNPSFSTLDVRYALQASGYSRRFTREQIGYGQLRADRALRHADLPLHVLTEPEPDRIFKLGMHTTVPIEGQVFGSPAKWEVFAGTGSAPETRDTRRLARGAGTGIGTLASLSLAGARPGVRTLIFEGVYRIPQVSGSASVCGTARPIGGSLTRRVRTVRYIAIQPPLAALTANQNAKYLNPTISGSRVAAEELPEQGPAERAVYTHTLQSVQPDWRGAVGTDSPALDAGDERHMVYRDAGGGVNQIRYHDFETGADRQLGAAVEGTRYNPTISGTWAAWREYAGSSRRIVAHDLTTDTTTTIHESTDPLEGPVVDDGRVVWHVWSGASRPGLWVHDLAAGQTRAIEPTTRAVCAAMRGDWVVWAAHESSLLVGGGLPFWVPIGHIYAHHLGSGTTRTLTDRPWVYGCPAIDGSLVAWTAFQDGPWVLFTHDLSANEPSQQLTFGQSALAMTHLDVSGTRVLFVDSQEQIADQLFLLDMNSF
ncbi:S8 family serine peptidase [Candidatus Binatia bacterium]|nr:S8 family serine peptidase [Candidatus Binatia bacterium]